MASESNKTLRNMDAKGYETLAAIMTTNTFTDAASVLNIDRTTLYNRMEKYGIREYIDSQAEEALSKLKLASGKAAKVLMDGLEDRRARYDSAKDILDRVGVSAKKQLDLTSGGEKITPILGGMAHVSGNDSDKENS